MRQAAIAIDALRVAGRAAGLDVQAEVVEVRTTGDADKESPFDQMGLKGVFAHELQVALFEGAVDVAVHSLKDLTSDEPEGLIVVCVLEREDPRDVLVSRDGRALAELSGGTTVGTSSARREALVRSIRPDVRTAPLRGNVDTRLRKVREGVVDAAVLAAAGLIRLQRIDEASDLLDPAIFVPAPGQGAIAVEARSDRAAGELAWLAGAEHGRTRACVDAERAFMRVIEGGCDVPLGAWALWEGTQLTLHGFVASRDGSAHLRTRTRGSDPQDLGVRAARDLLERGAADLVRRR